MNKLEQAREYAIFRHKNLYDGQGYSIHLDHVHRIALRFKLPEDVQIACYLHDLIEDTKMNYTLIKDAFGEYIAGLVYAVTNELGRNREERVRKTLQ